MARANLDGLTGTIDGLLDAALDFGRMPGAVEQIRQLFNGSKSCLAYCEPHGGLSNAITTSRDPDLDAFCAENFPTELGLFVSKVAKIPIGEVYQDHVLFGWERLRGSDIWREWMAPQDMYGGLGCRLLDTGSSYWLCDVQRGRRQDPFDAAELALFERLMPVMRRVTLLRQQLGGLSIEREMTRRALDELSLAIIIVDSAMQLTYANAAADELLAVPQGLLAVRGGKLYAHASREQNGLKDLVAGASDLAGARGQMLLRARSPEADDVSVCVTPLSASYALSGRSSDVMIVARVIAPARGQLAAAQQLFDLTEAEARLAVGLASGLSLAELAQRQGIKITTARTHLARIFWKTGTRQQSQVAALLRAAELPMRSR
ncbi:helix-turn-helix transcriptional regulator [Bosea vestrisii]|uniref:helix-turn-helix transcriptional regulator n=1 Tax=Bosea vestrisii TaxID=151416 RepID=UPI0024DFE417|nr:helix-turn-helix transcriptional regulator [Bosea vestrisii]WID97422.1 helix-turn-helix transcriptional regulator [Bosea vestrisii]